MSGAEGPPAGRNVADRAREAGLIARYLLGEAPRPEEAERWAHAVESAAAPLERARDRRLWALGMRSPFWLGLVDAGLALADPHSPVRHRVCLMLAVLEASPAHVRKFESRDEPWSALPALAGRGILAALRSAGGFALVRSWGWLWR
jgi:hypothetical protein